MRRMGDWTMLTSLATVMIYIYWVYVVIGRGGKAAVGAGDGGWANYVVWVWARVGGFGSALGTLGASGGLGRGQGVGGGLEGVNGRWDVEGVWALWVRGGAVSRLGVGGGGGGQGRPRGRRRIMGGGVGGFSGGRTRGCMGRWEQWGHWDGAWATGCGARGWWGEVTGEGMGLTKGGGGWRYAGGGAWGWGIVGGGYWGRVVEGWLGGGAKERGRVGKGRGPVGGVGGGSDGMRWGGCVEGARGVRGWWGTGGVVGCGADLWRVANERGGGGPRATPRRRWGVWVGWGWVRGVGGEGRQELGRWGGRGRRSGAGKWGG
ncbi:hypothetical protein Tco_0261275 [Tanacetum coccineum]